MISISGSACPARSRSCRRGPPPPRTARPSAAAARGRARRAGTRPSAPASLSSSRFHLPVHFHGEAAVGDALGDELVKTGGAGSGNSAPVGARDGPGRGNRPGSGTARIRRTRWLVAAHVRRDEAAEIVGRSLARVRATPGVVGKRPIGRRVARRTARRRRPRRVRARKRCRAAWMANGFAGRHAHETRGCRRPGRRSGRQDARSDRHVE